MSSFLLDKASTALAIPWMFFSLYARDDLDVAWLEDRYTNEHSRFLHLDGMRIHYREQGSGPPLVLLHGAFSSLHTWDEWAAQLATDFRVIRLDLPGFGLTGPPTYENYEYDTYTRFLARFLDAVGVEDCHMGGSSLGGLLAWRFALDYPERTRRLILVSAAGYQEAHDMPRAFRMARLPLVNLVMRHVTPRHVIASSLSSVFHNPDQVTPEPITRHHELLLRQGNRQAFVGMATGAYICNYAEKIRHLKVPTLIQWGDRDRWIPVAHAYRFRRDIRRARLVVYGQVGHVPMEELPYETAADARAFLLSRR